MTKHAAPIVIDARTPALDFGLAELRRYGELFFFLVWRDVRTRYAQSVMGIGWAFIQPAMQMVVFTVIFGGLANISSDGVPYPVFSYAALVAWTYFANSVTDATDSLVKHKAMVEKIYFPRLILPVSAVLARLLDFVIAMVLLIALMLWYSLAPTAAALALPLLVLLMMMVAAGLGMFLSAMAVLYRDVKYGLTFGIQLFMYAAPVVYPLSYVPERYRLLYALNPMVGVIEGFRASLLGTGPMPWDLVAMSAAGAVVILLGGAAFFRRKEHIFADVV